MRNMNMNSVFSLYTRKYIGCASICMVLELNSIFLHIRQLMVIQDVDRGSRAFRAIAVLNMATFIAFRIVVVAWMVFWDAIQCRHEILVIDGIVHDSFLCFCICSY